MVQDEAWRQLHGEGGRLDRDVKVWRRALEDRQLKVATRPEPEPTPDP